MNSGFIATAVILLLISGLMQWRVSKYFDGDEYVKERIITKYSSGLCFACAILFAAIGVFT